MAYTHFRYIAYQVPTVGDDGINFLNVGPGNATVLPRFAGAAMPAAITNITNPDARNRVAMLYAVLQDAQNEVVRLGDDVYTLKVFVAPEFYFRPDLAGWTTGGPSYSLAEYREIKQALRTLLNANAFVNWVVIPGTIMWSGTGRMGRRPNTANSVYFNSALYIKVGKYKAAGGKVLEKEQASQIDGLPTGRHGGALVLPNAFSPDEEFNPQRYNTMEKKRKHIFEHYGTNCGVEICLEHGDGLLKGILSDAANWREWLGLKRKSISLQIVTAGGMPIDSGNITVSNNGYLMRTDGLFNNAQPQSELKQVTGYINNNAGGAAVTYGFDGGEAQSVNLNPVSTINLNGQLARPNPGLAAFWFIQLINIYGRQSLP